jgi:hypothetical protein
MQPFHTRHYTVSALNGNRKGYRSLNRSLREVGDRVFAGSRFFHLSPFLFGGQHTSRDQQIAGLSATLTARTRSSGSVSPGRPDIGGHRARHDRARLGQTLPHPHV